MNGISFDAVLPVLVSVTGALALLWMAVWLLARALRRWGSAVAADADPEGAVLWTTRITRYLWRATAAASLLVAVLVMLYGVGIRGLPQLTWDEVAGWLRSAGIPLLFIGGSALVLIRAVGMATRSLPTMLVPSGLTLAERLDRGKRVETRGRLLRWTVVALVAGIAGYMALKTVGVDVTPLLAGGAIFSVALGFGAQNLVRDFLAGIFMILEDQLRVGDTASINGKTGQVEAINLRTTVLRGLDGTVHIIANGLVTDLSNMTKNYSYYVIDLGIAYEESVDRVMALLEEIGAELQADEAYRPKILAPLEVLGVDAFAASAVVIKLRIMTVPVDQWAVGRELRRRIKNRFDAEGIELPYPHVTLHYGSAGRPAAAGGAAPEAGARPHAGLPGGAS